MASNSFGESLGNALGDALRRLKGEQNTSKKKDEKSLREGEETLVKALNKMYETYRDTKNPKPNYNEKYFIEKPSKALPTLPSDYEIARAAESAARDKYGDKRADAQTTASETEGYYKKKKSEAINGLSGAYEAARERVAAERYRTEAKIAENGLTNSSIADSLRSEAAAGAERLEQAAYDKYREAVRNADGKISGATEKLQSALKTFDIAEAVAAEKELKRLKSERADTLNDYKKSYEKAFEDYEKDTAARDKQIKNDEAARDEEFRNGLTDGAVYEGAEAAEMENRYRVAESFYTSMPSDKALNLIMKSSDDLKFLLGSYYERLIKKLNK